jgi:predicted DCC family thiol-disulfide oxidoreductase YuxK
MKEEDFMKNPWQATLIYDGSCPLCSGAVGWIRENAIENSFVMLPCQAEERVSRFPGITQGACMNAMHLVLPDGTILVGEQAMPEVITRLKHYRFAALLFKLPGSRTVSRAAYQWFADRRYKIAAILSHFMAEPKKK